MSGIRESFEAAYNELEASDAAPDAGGVDAGVPADGGSADSTPAPVAAEPGGDSSSSSSVGPTTAEQRARDAAGRFAKGGKPTATATAAPVEPTAAITPPPPAPVTTPTEALKPPQSWKPLARERWAKLDPELQQEVLRREKDIATAMQEFAPAKRLHSDFQQMLKPYEAILKAEGAQPLQVMGSLLQTFAQLKTAPPAHKAQIVAQMIQGFGVPIDALDDVLTGKTPPRSQSAAVVDPNAIAAQVRQQVLQGIAQQRQQQLAQKHQTEIEAFAADPKNEFFEDVREEMADLIEVADRRGRTMSLGEAYASVLKTHPELSQVLQQREAAKAAATANAATQRAKSASSSVKSEPAGMKAPAPKDLRAQLAAAADKWESGKR